MRYLRVGRLASRLCSPSKKITLDSESTRHFGGEIPPLVQKDSPGVGFDFSRIHSAPTYYAASGHPGHRR